MVSRRQYGGLWAAALLTALTVPALASPNPHHLSKRSFHELECKGVYDASIYAKVERVCYDCYNLYREARLHESCRHDCFTTEYYLGCVEALQKMDELNHLKMWIKQLHGAEP